MNLHNCRCRMSQGVVPEDSNSGEHVGRKAGGSIGKTTARDKLIARDARKTQVPEPAGRSNTLAVPSAPHPLYGLPVRSSLFRQPHDQSLEHSAAPFL